MALPAASPTAVVLVTGASSGIGEQLARRLHGRGYGVVLNARDPDRLEELAAGLRAQGNGSGAGAPVHTVAADVAEDAGRAELLAALEPHEVVGVCNNAGFGKVGRLLDLDADTLSQSVRLNVLALHDLTVALVRPMVGRGAGAVLNVASTAAYQPVPGLATYAATKAFVQSFSEALHGELAGSGVSVTTLSPGPTNTEFGVRAGVQDEVSKVPAFLLDSPEHVAELAVKAMVDGRRSVTPRLSNKLQALGGRVVPRSAFIPLMGAIARRG